MIDQFTTDDDWSNYTGGVGTFANEDHLTIVGGHLVRDDSDFSDCQITWAGQELADGIRQIKFHTHPTTFVGTTDKIRLILKSEIYNHQLEAWMQLDGHMYLARMNDWGTFFAPIDSDVDIGSLEADTDYWFRAEMVGNDVTVGLYDADPDVGSPTPLGEFTDTLTGSEAATYGEGIAMEPGLNPAPGSNRIAWYDDFLIGEAGPTPPAIPGELLWPPFLRPFSPE